MSRILRRVTQRSVLALIASAGCVGLSSDVIAQTTIAPSPIGGPVQEFNLSDIPLAEGEQIVSSSVQEGEAVIQYGGGNYRMVDPGSVPTAAGGGEYPVMGAMPTMDGGFPMTGHPHANRCATGACGSRSCGTCGYLSGRPSQSVNLGGHPRLGSGGNVCGPTCNPYLYASADALYMKNDGVINFAGTGPFRMSDYDYELGGRYTLGAVPDCRNGYEVSLVYPMRWDSTVALNDPTGNIDTLLVPGLPIALVNLSSFNDAIFQAQRAEAEYLSFELNRTLIGWEVVKLLYGVRYIQYDEDYFYTSVRNDGSAGLLASQTENRMLGGQVGIDMTYPVTCRLWNEFRARAGAYANFAENDFQFSNNDVTTPANSLEFITGDDRTKLAGMFEIGGGARYYLTNNFHVRAGAELWYLSRVATATGQFSSVVTPAIGRRTLMRDDVMMFGVNAGAELKF